MNPFKMLVAPIAGVVNTWMEGRNKKAEAAATLDRVLAEASAKDSQVAGQIALARVQGEKDSWKDELALLTICAPYWVAMGSAMFGVDALYVQGMFENMGAIPEYWQETFQWAIWGALSIVGTKRVLSRP